MALSRWRIRIRRGIFGILIKANSCGFLVVGRNPFVIKTRSHTFTWEKKEFARGQWQLGGDKAPFNEFDQWRIDSGTHSHTCQAEEGVL